MSNETIIGPGELENNLREMMPLFKIKVWHRNLGERMEYYEIEYSRDGLQGTFSMMLELISQANFPVAEFVARNIERDFTKASLGRAK